MRRLLFAALLLAAPTAAAAAEVNLYTTREPGLLQPLLAGFTAQTGITVNTVFLQAGMAERVAAEGPNSPADVLMAVDVGNVMDLVKRNLSQPVKSAALEAAIPAGLRDPDGHWFALSLRARAIFVARDRVAQPPQTYEDLADPRFRGKVCVRSGQHPYNLSLFAAMLAKTGPEATAEYLSGLKANLARRPGGGDREVARDILAGICDVGLSNTYYQGIMLSGRGGAEQKNWGEAVRVVLPTFRDGGGTHVNISGAIVARHAPHAKEAVALLEYLVTPEAQRAYANINFENPVRPGVEVDPIVAGFGPLRPDTLPLPAIADQRAAASQIVDRVAFDR
ncbi:MAG: extracellular solute-binding protein [Gemmatimonadaceae bacterium]|nr:extracellular solute-binding protein [Acetobacteraceae bacterium]